MGDKNLKVFWNHQADGLTPPMAPQLGFVSPPDE